LPDNSAFQFGTGDFTIEFWMYASVISSGTVLYDQRPSTTQGAYIALYMISSTLRLYTSSADRIISSTISSHTWYHVALVRASSVTKLYLNGIQTGSSYSDSTNYLNGSSRPVIGASGYDFAGKHTGYISNLRIVKGTAVYTSAFTPPTKQLKVINNTSLLALQTPTVTKDSSNNNFTITNNGSVTVLAPISWPAAQKQYANGRIEIAGQLDDYSKTGAVSAFFSGDGYYLSTPSNTSFNFDTGDFTLEAWIYPINAGRAADALKYGTIISQFLAGSTGAGSNSWGLGIGMNGGVFSSITLETDGGSRLDVTGLTFPLKTWYHVAVVRNSGTLRAYINGVSVGSSSYGSAITNNPSGSVQIGRSAYATSYNNWLNGYISNVRITKGVAVYTGNFTVPTSPLTITQAASSNIAAITSRSSVSLLTCQDTGLTDESINLFPITNTGGVTTTIKQIPF
jgi:hypothetical protein